MGGGDNNQCPSNQQKVSDLSPNGSQWLYVVNDGMVNGEPRVVDSSGQAWKSGKCGYRYYHYESTLSNGSYCATIDFTPWVSQVDCQTKADEQQGKKPLCTTSDSTGGITQDQAECVTRKRSDILSFYQNNGWCTDKKEYYPGIINNWKNINGASEDQLINECGVEKKATDCTKGSPGSVTTEQSNCVLDKMGKQSMLTVYKNGGWCTDESNYRAIVNNWKNMGSVPQADRDKVASCFAAAPVAGSCVMRVQKDVNDPWAQTKTIKKGDKIRVGALISPIAVKANVTSLTLTGPNDFSKTASNEESITLDTAGNYSLKATGGGCDSAEAAIVTVQAPDSASKIVKFRFTEKRADLGNLPFNHDYTEGGVTIKYDIQDTSPGQKFIWVQFEDNSTPPKVTEPIQASIDYVGPPPDIKGVSCDVDLTHNSRLLFKVTGDNFGSTEGTIKSGGTNLVIDNWNDKLGDKQMVTAHLDNPSSAAGGTTYKVIITNKQGQESAEKTCDVGVTQISLGAKLICRSESNYDQENVDLTLVESLNHKNKNKEKVTIDKTGTISNIQTKLEEGVKYIACIKAPKSVRICSDEFVAVKGNNILSNFSLPIGDLNTDNTINGLDAGLLRNQWGPMKTNKNCDFNKDALCNSFEWNCMKTSYNKSSQPEPQ